MGYQTEGSTRIIKIKEVPLRNLYQRCIKGYPGTRVDPNYIKLGVTDIKIKKFGAEVAKKSKLKDWKEKKTAFGSVLKSGKISIDIVILD